MKRIIRVLLVTALMVVLMAAMASPAFATNDWSGSWGYGDKSGGGKTTEKYTGSSSEGLWGWACGNNKPTYKPC